MKERIVLEIPKDMCDNCNGCDKPTSALVECFLDEQRQVYETVKVPETFEEIKQLLHNDKKVFNKSVKKIEISEFMIEIHFKLQTICFLHNGEIVEPNCLRPIVTDRTPQQMWQIIKNLIGEE